MAEAQAAVVFVDFQDNDFDVGTDLREFGRMFHLLGPAQVGDVDQAVDTLFDLYEYAEVGEVAHFGGVA